MSNYEVAGFLQSSDNILQNPDSIQPIELAQYFQSYAFFGVHDHITSLVQRYFYANLNHPQLIRYLRLIDKFIQIAYPLPNAFPDMFIDCFRVCYQRGMKSSLEELKILRKMWTPLINPLIIQHLRQEIYNQTKIDADNDLREESKRFLRKHFQNTMKLPPWEISAILDTQDPLRKILIPIGQADNHREEDPQEWTHGRKRVKLDRQPQTMTPHSPPQGPQGAQGVQGPKAGSTVDKVRELLKNLNSITQYKCRECGKCFSVKKCFEKHREDHFHQRMKSYSSHRMNEGLRKLKLNKMQARREHNVSSFIGEKNQIVLDSTYIAVKQNTRDSPGPLKCTFCDRPFQTVFKDQMLYEDVLRVRFQPESGHPDPQPHPDPLISVMHATCYLALSQS